MSREKKKDPKLATFTEWKKSLHFFTQSIFSSLIDIQWTSMATSLPFTFVSVAVPYSSVPQMYSVLYWRRRQNLRSNAHRGSLATILTKCCLGNFLDPGSDHITLSLVVKVPGKYVGTKDTANDVPQMRHIIHIGQGAGDQNVLFTFYGKTVKESKKNVKSNESVHRLRKSVKVLT